MGADMHSRPFRPTRQSRFQDRTTQPDLRLRTPFFSMNLAVEIAVTIFAVSNSVRLVAYVPQILQVMRDREGATAVSCMTWLLFAVSHLSTVAYALLVINDWRMAAFFAANLLCCLMIIGLTVYKRTIAGRRARQGAV